MNNCEISDLKKLHSDCAKQGNIDIFLSKPVDFVRHNLHNVGKVEELLQSDIYYVYNGAFTRDTAEVQDYIN
jgi:hypothetical protein